MNLSLGRIVTILLVITAFLFAGCTGLDEPAVPEQVQPTITPVSTSNGTVAMTTALHPATTVQVTATESPVKIFNGEYHWVEYRINNTVTLVPGHRTQTEYGAKNERSSEMYNGIPAIHEKITITGDSYDGTSDGKIITIKNGFHNTDNLYFEKSTKRFLGGTRAVSKAGVDEPEEILPGDENYCEDCYRSWLEINPFEEMNVSLSADGLEPVTVPAGTYPDARKYTGNLLEGTPITFWVAPGVPVPVQYRLQNVPGLDGKDTVQMFELKGWG
ncbi:MAG: hypothetical protein WC379_14940 [Methanoregula sp.]|jgi:hypothetical protein